MDSEVEAFDALEFHKWIAMDLTLIDALSSSDYRRAVGYCPVNADLIDFRHQRSELVNQKMNLRSPEVAL